MWLEDGRSPKLSTNLKRLFDLLKSAMKQTFISCIQKGKQNGTGVKHLSLSIVLATNLTSRKVKVLKSKSDKIVFIQTGKHPGQLKDDVTSPGGTTIRGLQVMERGGIRGIMMDAVQASAERTTELGAK